jgi:hypothetical protein
METKPKIDMNIIDEDLIKLLKIRLTLTTYHRRTEVIANNILEMMSEKTLLYGGDDNSVPFKDKLLRAWYEGVGRKSNRVPAIMDRLMTEPTDKVARLELLDTYIDTCGYSLMALNSLIEELQDE